MTVTRDDIVQSARKYLRVPWVHCGRSKNTGVDCIGFIICVAYELNLLPKMEYPKKYPRRPDGIWFQSLLNQHMRLIPILKALPGDVVLFRTTEHPGHVGILTSQGTAQGLIHAYINGPGCVVEHLMTKEWWEKVVGVYRFPQGVLDDER
jgi:cell wall-associated NlpC family hydrolase